MENEQTIQELKAIRSNPRKMQSKFLEPYIQFLNENSPISWKLKERIDYVLQETKVTCYCGNPAKPNSNWCGIVCRNKDTNLRNNISNKNKSNKTQRTSNLKKTLLSKYGVDSIQKIPSVSAKTKTSKLKYYDDVIDSTFAAYGLSKAKLSDQEYLKTICANSSYSELSEKHFNGMPEMTIYRFFKRISFDPNFQKTSSIAEREIADFIQNDLGFGVIRNDRTLIAPKELDILVPEKNLAVEYHGLYWHAEKDHTIKLKMCSDKNISLIQIFEDEWAFKKQIIKSILTNKLGCTPRKISARKTKFSKIENAEAREFLDKNHLQGKINGAHYGLSLNGELVSLVTIGKSRFSKGIELLRYANALDTSVTGGFSKLLKNVKLQLNVNEIITYADLRFSTGKTYESFGKYSHTTTPGYFWVDKKNISTRINRFATQKHKLGVLLGTKYDSSLTEDQNMINSGYIKLFDAGHAVYLLQ
jgi:hypothetical protein